MADTKIQRYELGSVAWLNAFREWTKARLSDDFWGIFYKGAVRIRDTCALSVEATNPPAHLLRGGRATLGWYLRCKDSQIEIGDYPLADADHRMIADYDLLRKWYKLTDEEDRPFIQTEMPKLLQEHKLHIHYGDPERVQKLTELQWLMHWRDEFYSVYTA